MESRDPYGSRGSKSFIFGLTVSGLIVEILMDLVDLNTLLELSEFTNIASRSLWISWI